MMFGVTDIWAYILVAIVIVILPGPNSLYIFSMAARYGRRAAYLGIVGTCLGDTILMSLAFTGAVPLLQSNPNLFFIIKVIGAAYLSWIGLRLLYATWRKWRQGDHVVVDREMAPVDGRHPFLKGLLIDLLNPESILFFLSFFVQFIDPTYPRPLVSLITLGVIFLVVSVSYLSVLIFLGVRLAAALRKRRWLVTGAESGAGALFVGFGVKLATTVSVV
ncbi:MAG: leucine efflux protein LeuE [Ottowia sp.]|nr:leucine efflux protein LeuE [Ottowia sp.]